MMFNPRGAISSGPIGELKSRAEPAVDGQVTTMTDKNTRLKRVSM